MQVKAVHFVNSVTRKQIGIIREGMFVSAEILPNGVVIETEDEVVFVPYANVKYIDVSRKKAVKTNAGT